MSQDCQFHALLREVSFSFLDGQCNSFLTLPSLSELLPRVSRRASKFGLFSLVVDSNSVIIAMLIEVSIKCCCIAVWQTKCIQCARNNFFERLNFVVFYFRSTKHSIFVVNFQVFLKEILGFR